MVRSSTARVAVTSVVFAASLAPAWAGAVTESRAVREFLEQSPQARRVPLIERSVDAASRADARVSNPRVAYAIEDAADVRDEFLTFEQALPITGRRGLLGERAAVAASAARLGAESEVRLDAYALKRTFHEAVYRRRVVDALRQGEERLAEVVGILERREAEGEGSGYDVLRSRQELADLRMRLTEAEAALLAARARFGSFFDPGSWMHEAVPEGDLSPGGPIPDVGEATDDALTRRLDLRALSERRRSVEIESRAARRQRFPEPVLTAGWKRTAAAGLTDTGYVASLTVPLPIFDRGTLDAARANADANRLELDREILTRRIRAEVRTALARERAAREAVERYGPDLERRADDLSRIARLRYDEGEGDILELLDAHRTSLTLRLRALDARHEAKAAEIDRNRVIGNEVQP